jgi:type IV conjugative transfer system lipoprotein TraV
MSLVESVRAGDKFYGYPMNTFEGKPIRSGENVQQIWIGPYEDNDGNYHEPSYIYSVTKKGQWIGEPVKEIQD